MRKTTLALVALAAALALPAVASAALNPPAETTFGNDLGKRSAVVVYALPTTATEGPLTSSVTCTPAPGSVFPVGETEVSCSALAQVCFPLIGCISLPVSGKFALTVTVVRCTAVGTGGANTINGTPAVDWLCGRGGGDVLAGKGGADRLEGGDGADTLVGAKGKDRLLGGRGNDTLKARDGVREMIDCGGGRKDLAIVDGKDFVSNCERVRVP